VAICGTAPAAICSVLYLAIKPAKLSVPYAIGMCMIYAAWVAICRAFLLERHYTVSIAGIAYTHATMYLSFMLFIVHLQPVIFVLPSCVQHSGETLLTLI
jgi:hypothetical protein